jgi:hypothetical protein
LEVEYPMLSKIEIFRRLENSRPYQIGSRS